MNRPVELKIVLRFENRRLSQLEVTAHRDLAAAHQTSTGLDDLEARAQALATQLGVEAEHTRPEAPSRTTPLAAVPSWDEMVARAKDKINKGDAAGMLDVDALLAPGEAERIEDLHEGGFRLDIRLDPWDLVAAVSAGVAGAIVDQMVVRVPSGGFWRGEWDSGSLLTIALRAHAFHNDNWFSAMTKVPYDRVAYTGIAGLGPLTHRVHTFGHDPLLGWVLGTMDIMRGTLTGASAFGQVRVIDAGGGGHGLLAALGLQALHLVSDVGTKMGLPLPGWTSLLAVPWKFGPDDVTVAEIARWMYVRGYNSWHFLTMATVPATVEGVVRSYVGARRMFDPDYDSLMEMEGMRAGTTKAVDHPRYRAISLVAHAVATAGNAGRFLIRTNPLMLNYAEWLFFSKRLLESFGTPTPSDLLTNQERANRMAIDTGWAQLGVNDELPPLD